MMKSERLKLIIGAVAVLLIVGLSACGKSASIDSAAILESSESLVHSESLMQNGQNAQTEESAKTYGDLPTYLTYDFLDYTQFSKYWNNGIFRGGDDLEPGDYCILPVYAAGPYYGVRQTPDDFTWSNYRSVSKFTIKDGEYVRVHYESIIVPAGEVKKDSYTDYGIFEVGKDIAPGTYKLVSNKDEYSSDLQRMTGIKGSYQISEGDPFETDVVSCNILFMDQTYITLEEGNYIVLTNASLGNKAETENDNTDQVDNKPDTENDETSRVDNRSETENDENSRVDNKLEVENDETAHADEENSSASESADDSITETSSLEESYKPTISNEDNFTNEYGTKTTKCRHSGCNNYIASSGDTAYCETHSKRCAECNKYIDEDAVYCMDCIERIADEVKKADRVLSSEKEVTNDDERNICWELAQKAVKNQLKSPSSAKFPFAYNSKGVSITSSGNSYTVRAWVEAQNSFGATIKDSFTVKIEKSGTTFTVISCDIQE